MGVQYDVIIIGGGPGGYTAAFAAVRRGMTAALIEQDRVGGTCLNRGCIPTKTLLHTAEQFSAIQSSAARGLLTGAESVRVNIPGLYEEKAEVTARLSENLEKSLKSSGVRLINGHAEITGQNTVAIKTADGETVLLSGKNILLAVGSRPVRLPIPGADSPGVYTSDEFLDQPPQALKRLIIIGGGVIGAEFAECYRALGVEVTILEMMPAILATLDPDLSKNAGMILKKRGVKIVTGAAVRKIRRDGENLVCDYEVRGKVQSAEGDAVLISTGRRPAVENLFAEGCQPDISRGITVNEHFETSIPGVFAVGDVTGPGTRGGIKLAHAAAAQAKNAIAFMAGDKEPVNLSAVPSCVYLDPEIASVGMTEEAAKKAGFAAASVRGVMYSNARTLIGHGERSFVKLVFDQETGKILGAHLMCRNASDMISEYSEAIISGIRIPELLAVIRPHPTFEEAGNDALEAALEKLDSYQSCEGKTR